jgi:DNA-binding response OmpR family regulator
MADTEHIVVVDDEEGIRLQLDEFLTSEGYRVTAVSDGAGLRQVMDNVDIDLVLLDVHLPGEDGITIVRDYLSKTDVGVIMLTSRTEIMDRVVGLEVGADDYIPKPYHLRELLARVRSVLRRRTRDGGAEGGAGPIPKVRFADWVLDYMSRSLTSPEGKNVPLTSSEFSLLVVFIQNPNRVLTRDELLNLAADRKWEPLDRAIDVLVGRLRRKVERNSKAPQLIKTVRGAGYIFTSEVVPA